MNFQHENEVNERVGWFKAMRTDEAIELIAKNPLAYTLAAMIALRARWRAGFNRHGLDVGEAMLGDFEKCGMSEKQYRTAKKHLEDGGFAAFKRSNKGTIARLIDTRLFGVFESQEGGQKGEREADKGQSGGEQGATNEERIDVKKAKTQERINDAPFQPGSVQAMPGLPAHRVSKAFEERIMARLRTLLGDDEMGRAGGMWRAQWVRSHPAIVQSGLEELDQKIKESDRGVAKEIINRGAWLMDWCKRMKRENGKKAH